MFYSILTRKCDSTGGGLTHYGSMLIPLVSWVSRDQGWRCLHQAAAVQTIVMSRELNRLGVWNRICCVCYFKSLFIICINTQLSISNLETRQGTNNKGTDRLNTVLNV